MHVVSHVLVLPLVLLKFLQVILKNDCFSCVAIFIDGNELFLEMENETSLINTTPNFTIQSLLGQMLLLLLTLPYSHNLAKC